MEKFMKKLSTLITWYTLSLLWEASVKYRTTIPVPKLEYIHEQFQNLLEALGRLGDSALEFDSQVRNRLALILYWATYRKIDVTTGNKSTEEVLEEVREYLKENIDIKYNPETTFEFCYRVNRKINWESPRFPDGTIWGKEMYSETKRLAYLVNIVLNWKVV